MRIALMMGCFAALGIISTCAQAGFVDDESKQVVVFGKAAATEEAVGLGNKAPLREALQQIIPRDYSQNTNALNPEDLERKVSWRGGKSWVDVLKDVLQDYAWITVKIDTTKKVVTFQGEGMQLQRLQVASVATSRKYSETSGSEIKEFPAQAVNSTGAKTANVDVVPHVVEQKAWAVSIADRYIRVSLSRWAKEAGFQLVWDVNRDIEISVDSIFFGSFDEVLLKVLKSLEVSDYPVEAEIYDNRVIRIVKVARKD